MGTKTMSDQRKVVDMAINDAFSGKAEVIARSDVATTVRWIEIYSCMGQYSPGVY